MSIVLRQDTVNAKCRMVAKICRECRLAARGTFLRRSHRVDRASTHHTNVTDVSEPRLAFFEPARNIHDGPTLLGGAFSLDVEETPAAVNTLLLRREWDEELMAALSSDLQGIDRRQTIGPFSGSIAWNRGYDQILRTRPIRAVRCPDDKIDRPTAYRIDARDAVVGILTKKILQDRAAFCDVTARDRVPLDLTLKT